jgi:phage/plasmid-like protein (TIGR03299 family)
MAYVGKTPWHGLGQQLTEGASLEKWAIEAGLNWQLLEGITMFSRELPDGGTEFVDFPGNKVLYRSDTGQPLSIVSDRYQKVQPIEVLEFFREFAAAGDMSIETAGTLSGGSKVWALAKIAKESNINKHDPMKFYVLLATSCDRTLATTGQLTSVRVVCNNTLQMAIGNKTKNSVKVPHSTKFNPQVVKQEMGLVSEAIDSHTSAMQKMHKIGVTDDQAMRFFIELLKTPEEKKSGVVDLDSKRRAIPKMWTSYKSAPGAEDTLWGAVNAVTHSVDFNPHARSADTRLNSAWFGQGATIKADAYQLASDTSFLDSIVDVTKQKTDTDGSIERLLDKVAI